MKTTIYWGRANSFLGGRLCEALDVSPGRFTLESFPDDEIRVEIKEEIQENDVYLLQPTHPPVAGHLLELLLLADAARRAGAARITGVIPYFGYARQDRRDRGGEPVGARLMADLLSTRLDRLITVDLHNPAIEGFFGLPVVRLSAVPLLAEALKPVEPEKMVLVAPDLGAVKLAQGYADILDLPVAYLHKVRESGRKVTVRRIIGSVEGKTPIIVDDMISTGGTIVKAAEALIREGAREEITVAATHGLLVGDCLERFSDLPIRRVLVTDSINQEGRGYDPLSVVGLARILAEAIRGLRG